MSPVLVRRPAVGPPRPAVRLRTPPALEPPFDDESPSQTWAGPGTAEQLALDWQTRGPAVDDPPVPPRPADDRSATPVAGASAEAKTAVERFVRLCLEIFNGYRPTGHIRSLTGPAEAGAIIDQLALTHARIADVSRQAAQAERSARRHLTAAAPPRRSGRARPVGLRRLRLCEPCQGAVEAAVVLGVSGRVWALALRLERRRGRWLCTAARTV